MVPGKSAPHAVSTRNGKRRVCLILVWKQKRLLFTSFSPRKFGLRGLVANA